MPRWLSEGISVYEERQENPAWGQSMTPQYRELILEGGATKVSLTHFKDREGGELSNISPRRYFCMQCHVPQTDAKPLVGNRFESAVGVR